MGQKKNLKIKRDSHLISVQVIGTPIIKRNGCQVQGKSMAKTDRDDKERIKREKLKQEVSQWQLKWVSQWFK